MISTNDASRVKHSATATRAGLFGWNGQITSAATAASAAPTKKYSARWSTTPIARVGYASGTATAGHRVATLPMITASVPPTTTPDIDRARTRYGPPTSANEP